MSLPRSWKRLLLFVLTALSGVVRNLMLAPLVENPSFGSNQPEQINDQQRGSAGYLHSFKSFQRKLEFLHIPKTAGSTIEELIAARQANVSWGMCRFLSVEESVTPESPCFGTKPNWFLSNETKKKAKMAVPWFGTPNFWHTPPHLFPPRFNPYQTAEVFTVIRDPVDRALSEFHYRCFLYRWRRPKKLCEMGPTAYFEQKLNVLRASSEVAKYGMDDSHLVSQYEYIMRPLQVRQVDYVLWLDPSRIGGQFNRTVQAFNLPMYWPGSDARKIAVDRTKHKAEPLETIVEKELKSYFVDDYALLQ